jgi:hypothetical protein
MPNMKTVGQRNLKLLGQQIFFSQDPFDLKINRDHLLIRTNLHAKYEDCGSWNLKLLGGQGKTDGRPSRFQCPPYNFIVRGYNYTFH